MIKKIEEMDFYDLLNLRLDASPQDIENAYLLAVATYHQEGLASYGALSDADRGIMLDRIEEAFETLRNPEKKKAYDLLALPRHPEFQRRAFFRRSTKMLEIEDAPEEANLWNKIKAAVNRSRNRGDGQDDGKDGPEHARLPEDFFYYGDYLKKIRERQGLSREDIAERCGINPDRIESLENESSPYFPQEKGLLEELRLYAKCLGFGSEGRRASRLSDRFDE